MFAAIFSGKIKTTAITMIIFCTAIVVTAAIGSYSSVSGIQKVDRAWYEFADKSFPKIIALSNIRSSAGYGGYIHNFKNYVLRFDQKYDQRVNNFFDETVRYVEEYRSIGSLTAAEAQALDSFEKTLRKYQAQMDKLRKMTREGASIVEVDAAVKVNDAPAIQALETLETLLVEEFQSEHKSMENTLSVAERQVAASGITVPVLIFALAIILSWFSRRILVQLGGEPSRLLTAAEQLREGDLAAAKRGTVDSKKGVQGALRITIDKLQQVIQQAQTGVETVSNGVGEISCNQDKLSQRTSELAIKLEETSVGMESMTTTIRENSSKASKANGIASVARKQTEESGDVVSQAVTAMSELKEASKRIADITTVIDEIAFQTNLLALNAAVEAARAGEHGKGFAVVASEVRNLAQRSASAAKEIKGLIEDSVSKANDSTDIVNRAGEALETIRSSIEEVDTLVSEIDVANQEQTLGIDDITAVIRQLDQFTRETTGLVEETNAATSSMKTETNALQHVVSFFRTADDSVAPSNNDRLSLSKKNTDFSMSNTNGLLQPPPQLKESPVVERRGSGRPWADNSTASDDFGDDVSAGGAKKVANTDWDSF